MPTTLRRGSLVALACLALAAPVAHAADDPYYPVTDDIWKTGVPAGQTEHGVLTRTNVLDPHDPFYRRVEYWATSDRFIETDTDRAGRLLSETVSGPEATTIFVRETLRNRLPAIRRIPIINHATGPWNVPFPGYSPPYARDLIASGVLVPVAPQQQQTIAGFTGTLYQEHYPKSPPPPGPDEAATVTTDVLQDGTFQPLMRESKTHRKGKTPFDVQERLQSRETMPSAQARVQLTPQTYKRTVRAWRAKVKAAKAKAKKRHHGRSA